jgi:hypothetical protein
VGGDQRLAVADDELGKDRRDQGSSRTNHHRNHRKKHAGYRQADLVEVFNTRNFHPGDPDDECAEDNFQQRVRQLHDDERAKKRADHTARHERSSDIHADKRALVPGPPCVGAKLHRAMHRDQHRHRHENAQQSEHCNTAANTK